MDVDTNLTCLCSLVSSPTVSFLKFPASTVGTTETEELALTITLYTSVKLQLAKLECIYTECHGQHENAH